MAEGTWLFCEVGRLWDKLSLKTRGMGFPFQTIPQKNNFRAFEILLFHHLFNFYLFVHNIEDVRDFRTALVCYAPGSMAVSFFIKTDSFVTAHPAYPLTIHRGAHHLGKGGKHVPAY